MRRRDPVAARTVQCARRVAPRRLLHAAPLEKVAVEAALRGFGELPPWSATGAQVLALVQTDSLVAKSEKAVFQLVVAVVGGRRAARGRAARKNSMGLYETRGCFGG